MRSFRIAPMLLMGISICVSPALGAPRVTLASAVNAIMERPAVSRASFALEVYDIDHGKVVFAHNARKTFKAASTTKLVTEGTTLALLGEDYRFHTKVYGTGAVLPDGRLSGDLVLVAAGDPNLSNRIQPDGTLAFENEDHSYDGTPDTKAVPGDPLAVLRELAKQVAAKGVTRVTGHVIVDTSLFPEGEVEGGTGVTISPIVVNDNIVDVTITPGAKPGDPTSMSVSPQTPYATFVNASATGDARAPRSINLANDIADANGDHRITIGGMLPAGGPAILYAYDVPSPSRFAEVAFAQALQDAGVQATVPPGPGAVTGNTGPYNDANLLAEHVSPPLNEDVKITLKVSDNLHASMQPYLWASILSHAKSNHRAVGFAMEHAFLSKAGLDLTGADQSDGLGDSASFAPDFMVNYLLYMRKQPYFAAFERGLPVLGVDGTLFNIQNGTPGAGHVHAKTGTWAQADLLNGGTLVTAKGLAGFMTTKDGRHLAFCFYINNMFVKNGIDPAGEGHVAGQVLGEIANAAYLYAP